MIGESFLRSGKKVIKTKNKEIPLPENFSLTSNDVRQKKLKRNVDPKKLKFFVNETLPDAIDRILKGLSRSSVVNKFQVFESLSKLESEIKQFIEESERDPEKDRNLMAG
jgi:hypothetical protein